jgi:hypothetical protein
LFLLALSCAPQPHATHPVPIMTHALAEAAGAADGEIDVRKAWTVGHGPWTIDRALFTGRRKIRRGHKWERVDACEIRKRSTEGNHRKTEAKSIAHVVD